MSDFTGFGEPLNINYQPTTGDSPFMTSDDPQGPYAKRQRKQPPMTSGPMAGMSSVQNMQERRRRSKGKK